MAYSRHSRKNYGFRVVTALGQIATVYESRRDAVKRAAKAARLLETTAIVQSNEFDHWSGVYGCQWSEALQRPIEINPGGVALP